MTLCRRSRWIVPLALTGLLPLLLAADVEYTHRRVQDGPVPRSLVELLEKGRFRTAAERFAYPDGYSTQERREELRGVADTLRLLLGRFGGFAEAVPVAEPVTCYDVSVGSGPRPGWWASVGEPGETRLYLYAVEFDEHGPGFVIVTTWATRTVEKPVMVGLGLAEGRPAARSRVDAAFHAMLDSAGVPADHPMRSVELPTSEIAPPEAPAASP